MIFQKQKKNGTQYSEFKKKYRPVGDDSSIKKLWNEIKSCEYDDWILLFNDSLEI